MTDEFSVFGIQPRFNYVLCPFNCNAELGVEELEEIIDCHAVGGKIRFGGGPRETELMSEKIHEGGCVCGDVRYKVIGDPDIVVVCHCEWCQRRTGSAFAMIPKWETSNFELTAGNLTLYRTINDSGRWLDLGFCARCGTNIGFTQERRATAQAIDAGTLDDPSIVNRHKHDFRYIYVRSHRDWTEIPKGEAIYEGGLPTDVTEPPPRIKGT